MIDVEGLRRSLIDLGYGCFGFAVGVAATIFVRRIKMR